MLTQAQVEEEILRLSERLEEATLDLAPLAERSAHNEVEYKRTYAREFLRATGTVAEREQHASRDSCDALLARRLAEGVVTSQQELLRTLRSELDALRTIAANIRAVT